MYIYRLKISIVSYLLSTCTTIGTSNDIHINICRVFNPKKSGKKKNSNSIQFIFEMLSVNVEIFWCHSICLVLSYLLWCLFLCQLFKLPRIWKKNQFECLIAVMVAIILNYSKWQQQTAPTLKVQSVKFTKDVSVTVIYI